MSASTLSLARSAAPTSSPMAQVESIPDVSTGMISSPTVDGHFFFIASGVVVGVMTLLVLCAVHRIRLVRRRRIVLGLPPVTSRRATNEDLDLLRDKPVLYDAWTDFQVKIRNEKISWDKLQVLSSARLLSLPMPAKPEEKHDLFNNYFTSILELVSVDRLDKSLLSSMPKESRPTEYARSELVTSVLISMPQSGRDSTMEDWELPELEFGVYEALEHLDIRG